MKTKRFGFVSFGIFLVMLCSGLPLVAEALQVDRYGVWDARFPGRKIAENYAIMQYPLVLSSRPDKRRVDVFFEYRGDLAVSGKAPIEAVFNGKPVEVERRSGTANGTQWVRAILRLPDNDMKYAEKGAPNELKLVLNGKDGTSVAKVLTIPGLTLSTMDQRILDGKAADINSFNYTMAVKIPPTKLNYSAGIPKIGEVGFGFQMTGKLAYYPFAKKKSNDLNGGMELKAGAKKYGVKVGSKSSATWKDGGWEYEEWKAYLAFSQTITLWELSFFGALPPDTKKTVESIPFVGEDLRKGLEGFKATLEAEPTITGSANLGLRPDDPLVKSWGLTGEMDVRLSINMSLEITALGKFGAKALLGGKVELGLDSAANPLFKTCKGQIYVGADLYFACFESSFRYALLEFDVKTAPKGAMPQAAMLGAGAGEAAPFRIMEVPTVDEVFPLQGLTQAGTAKVPVSKEVNAMALRFRQLSGPAMPKASAMALGATPSEVLVENSATLPIVDNVTPLAWPTMTATTDTQMVIFGVDTRETGVKPTNPVQFSKLMWTLCDPKGNWSAPKSMPEGNGAAQMMASAAWNNEDSFVAVWQQMRDPNFKGEDPGSWMNQNEIVSARYDLKSQSWTPLAISKPVPGTGDYSPKMAMGVTLPDMQATGLAVWLNGKIPDFSSTGNRPSKPEDVSFHWSRYKESEWITPDYATAEGKKWALKAPKGLLSFDLAALHSGYLKKQGTAMLAGVLVYSYVADDGATKLACRYFSQMFSDDEEIPEGDPIWSPEYVIADKGVNLNPVVKLRQMTTGFIVWNQDGNLVSTEFTMNWERANFKKPTVIRPATVDNQPFNLQAIAFKAGDWQGGKLKDEAVAWTEQTDDGPSIMVTVQDHETETWSEPMALTPGDAMEMLCDLRSDRQGNLMPMYVHTDINYETVEVKGENGQVVKVESAPVAGQESIRVGKFKPMRAVGFAPNGLSTSEVEFMGGTKVKLTAAVTNYGMMGVKPVTVSFYQGDPKKGGVLLGKQETKTIPGGATVEVSLEWSLAEDIWDKDNAATEVFAVMELKSAHGVRVLNDTARLNLENIRLDATTEVKTLLADGSFTLEVGIQNSGAPHTEPFPVVVYDYAGVHEVARGMMPRVGAGGFEEMAIEMPAGSAGTTPQGKDFLVKVDPENTLKQPGNPKLEKLVHVPPRK